MRDSDDRRSRHIDNIVVRHERGATERVRQRGTDQSVHRSRDGQPVWTSRSRKPAGQTRREHYARRAATTSQPISAGQQPVRLHAGPTNTGRAATAHHAATHSATAHHAATRRPTTDAGRRSSQAPTKVLPRVRRSADSWSLVLRQLRTQNRLTPRPPLRAPRAT